MHNIAFCQLESTFGSPDRERAHMSGQTKMIGTRGGVMCNGQPAPILNSSCGQRVMAKTKMESFARFSSNSLHSIYSQHIAFKRQYLMSYRTIYSFNLSSSCVTFQGHYIFPSPQSTTFRNLFSMFIRYYWTFQPYLSNPIISFHPYLIRFWPLVTINSGQY